MERCGTEYNSLTTLVSMVKSDDDCRQFCVDRGQYAYGLECPETIKGEFKMQCFCFPREAWTLEKNILPLTDCMGKPTDVLTISTQYNGTNRHCSGPYMLNGKGTGGACRNMLRRTCTFFKDY